MQLIADYDTVEEVNVQLDKMYVNLLLIISSVENEC